MAGQISWHGQRGWEESSDTLEDNSNRVTLYDFGISGFDFCVSGSAQNRL